MEKDLGGRPPVFKEPEEMLEMWEAYKAKIDSNPDRIEQATPKGEVVVLSVRKPYLRVGFEAFVFRQKGHGIRQYIDNNNKLYDKFIGVVSHIRSEWEEDQISGTLTGRYKAPNLVARLNGLVDKTDITSKDAPINELKITVVESKGGAKLATNEGDVDLGL
jgi:hypothetical protein